MTDPTGRCFISYRRTRKDDVALLVSALHDHGIPTWQDVKDLGSVHTEDEIRRILADPATASAVLYITPDVEESAIIRQVEVPGLVNRAAARDGFFVVPVAAGGLDYAKAAAIASNHVSAQDLAAWNMHKIPHPALAASDAAEVARRVLVQRVSALHRALPGGEPLRLGLYVRRGAAFEAGVGLTLDWSARFAAKEAAASSWDEALLPAMSRIADAVRTHAPGRPVEAFGIPTLPAAAALGCAFLSTSGLQLSWRQVTPGKPEQIWTLTTSREESGFVTKVTSKDPAARDLAVLVSVTDSTEPLFAGFQRELPPLRAWTHIMNPGKYPYLVTSGGIASDIASKVQEALREARRSYGNIGTVHLFMAAPAGLAVMIGQSLNTFGSVQTYEHVPMDGTGTYRAAALLRPCT
jgi:hypothetical protein